jgi:hypothetical protein
MSYPDDLDVWQSDDPPDGYIPAENALDYAAEHQWEEILALVTNEDIRHWLKESTAYFKLLSIVSRHDKDQLRDALKIGAGETVQSSPEITDAQLFSVATDACNFLESLAEVCPRPEQSTLFGPLKVERRPEQQRALAACAESCQLGEDLSWARELVLITRKLRDLLFSIGEPKEPFLQSMELREPLDAINAILQRHLSSRVVYWQTPDKALFFDRVPNDQTNSLCSCIADWFANYLVDFYPGASLAVCIECGTFFPRQRKDNIYCTKTCQNRVAYKRKKIFDTEALSEISVDPETTAEITRGLWVYHNRLGLGVIESVDYGSNRQLGDFPTAATDSFKAKYLALRTQSIRVRIRFLHGVRTLGFDDLFGGKEETRPKFYSVKSPELVASLL